MNNMKVLPDDFEEADPEDTCSAIDKQSLIAIDSEGIEKLNVTGTPVLWV